MRLRSGATASGRPYILRRSPGQKQSAQTRLSLGACDQKGVTNGARTHNLLGHNQVLCHLSYGHHTAFVQPVLLTTAIDQGASSGTWIRTTIRGSKVPCPAIRRSPNAAPDAVRGRKRWCRGPDLNWGHRNFQSRALPTELPRRKSAQRSIHSLWRMPPQQWVPYAIGQPLYTGRAGDENRTHDLLLGKETFYR